MSNVLLTFLSKINSINEFVYKSDIGDIRSTINNETGVKYFINKLKKEGKKLDSIIYVATKEVRETTISDNINTSESYFKKVISTYSKNEFGYVPQFIAIDYNMECENFNKPLINIIKNINKDDNIFIDTTGGARNTTYLLLLTSKTLEYRGNKVLDVIYINILNGNLKKIEEINDLFSMFDLINGVDEFTSFGSSSTLNKFFKNNTKESDIHKLVEEMQKFEESIKLCKTNKLQEILNNIDVLMNNIENNDYASDKEVLFKQLIPVVRDKFMIKKNKKVSVIQLIKWCINNKLIQQAITIYVEQIPKYIFDNKIIYIERAALEKIKVKDYEDIYCKWFYSNFMGLYNCESNSYKFRGMLLKDKQNNLDENCSEGFKNLKVIEDILNHVSINNLNELKMFFVRKNKVELYNLLEHLIKKNKCKNYSDILQAIKKDQKYCDLLLHPTSDIEKFCKNYLINAKIKTIENVFKYNNKYKYNKLYDIQNIMRDYLLIKLIRNKINHASDMETLNKDYISYFEENGYKISIDIKIEEVIKILNNAVNRLKA